MRNIQRKRATDRQWRLNNPERKKAQNRKYYHANKDKAREYYQNNKYNIRLKIVARKYNISIEEYVALLEKQGRVCAVCGRKPNGIDLHIDHDHKTGKVRGLLCSQCNTALGLANDSPEILERLAKYVRG